MPHLTLSRRANHLFLHLLHSHMRFVLLLTYSVEIHFPSLSSATFFACSIVIIGLFAQLAHQVLLTFIDLKVAVQIVLQTPHSHMRFVLLLMYSSEMHFPPRLIA